MRINRLNKRYKLCSKTAIDEVFNSQDSRKVIHYPLKAIYKETDRHDFAEFQLLVSVPKKRLRRAVDRVLIRRRIRESFRIGRVESLKITSPIDIAIIYMADKIYDYSKISKSISLIFKDISERDNDNKNID